MKDSTCQFLVCCSPKSLRQHFYFKSEVSFIKNAFYSQLVSNCWSANQASAEESVILFHEDKHCDLLIPSSKASLPQALETTEGGRYWWIEEGGGWREGGPPFMPLQATR